MTDRIKKNTLIIDIGKTNIKLHVLDKSYCSVFSKQMNNTVNHEGAYPSTCVDNIWQWLVETIKEVGCRDEISSLTITTHGATAALIDRNSTHKNGLVLPVLDYEYAEIFNESVAYDAARPNYNDTFSPSLPAGLNLGRQLHWLKTKYPIEFAKTSDILMYPQYWAWRFTGQCFSEITSLGCHTDLWSIKDGDYSSLVDELNCRDKLPPLEPAWHNCGKLLPEVITELGLNEDCEFFNGLHDSNASFLRYRLTQKSEPFTVVSTGTWTILMASQVPLSNLEAKKDMLANIDALGEPIACARFMGGREFEAVCKSACSWLGEQFVEEDLQKIIEQQVFALPDFSEGSGPFGGEEGKIIGPVENVVGIALATVYCALMIDYQLDMLEAKGKVFIEGAFLKNPLLCAIINQLRPDQDVYLSLDATGTVQGAAYLTNWDNVECDIETSVANTTTLVGLQEYKQQWLESIASR